MDGSPSPPKSSGDATSHPWRRASIHLHPSPLYVICDADACARAGWSVRDFAHACLRGGARVLQLRAKQVSSAWWLDEAAAVVALAREYAAQVIVNDRADIAVLAGADGVHVGQDDLSPALVRRVVGDTALVGLSTHTRAQATHAATTKASYLAVGPVFSSQTKDTGYGAVGLPLVAEAAEAAATVGRPLVAIGGITLDRAPEVLRAGAAAVAVISDLWVGGDPKSRVRAYLRTLERV